MNNIERIQDLIGAKVDGIFGPKSRAALASAPVEVIKKVQHILGVEEDGQFGLKSEVALASLIGFYGSVKASSFADEKDVAAFKRCKSGGHSDLYCFRYGDNGIGFWGNDTTTTSIRYAALPAAVLRARFGSLRIAGLKPLRVFNLLNGKKADGLVGDIMTPDLSSGAQIDLNPGFQVALDAKPPFLIPVHYDWI